MRHLIVTDSDIIESIAFEHNAFSKSAAEAADKAQGTLEVVFKGKSDTAYRYENVHSGVFVCLVEAESIGKEFHRLFRATKYPFTKSQRPPTLKK